MSTCENCNTTLSGGAEVCGECNYVLVEILGEDFDPINSVRQKYPFKAMLVRERSALIAKRIAEKFEDPDPSNTDHRNEIREIVGSDDSTLTMMERGIVLQNVLDELFGFSRFGPFLRDPCVDAIYCAGAGPIFCNRNGRLRRSVLFFDDSDQLWEMTDRLFKAFDVSSSKGSSKVEFTFPGGQKMSVCVPPLVNEVTVAIAPTISR